MAHLQPGRFLLDARMRHRQLDQLEAVSFCVLLEHRNRLFAKRRIVINERDFLAFQTAFFRHVLHQNIGRTPIGAEQREAPLEDAAIGRFAATVAGGEHRNLVGKRLFRQRKRNAG